MRKDQNSIIYDKNVAHRTKGKAIAIHRKNATVIGIFRSDIIADDKSITRGRGLHETC